MDFVQLRYHSSKGRSTHTVFIKISSPIFFIPFSTGLIIQLHRLETKKFTLSVDQYRCLQEKTGYYRPVKRQTTKYMFQTINYVFFLACDINSQFNNITCYIKFHKHPISLQLQLHWHHANCIRWKTATLERRAALCCVVWIQRPNRKRKMLAS